MKGQRKRLALLSILAMVLVMAFTSVVSAAEVTGLDAMFAKSTPVRVFGQTRYDTAVETAKSLKKVKGVDKFDTVIVAYGQDFPDALAGGYLAQVKGAPIITVNKTAASEKATLANLKNLLKDGGNVYILGGEGVVTKNFQNTLDKEGYKVERLAGQTRYATNLKILEEAGVAENKGLIVAAGGNYADALSASAASMPVLLVNTSVTADQMAFVKEYAPEQIYVVGGEGAVNKTVFNALAKDYKVKRVAGQTRYQTSVAVAKEFFNAEEVEAVTLAYAFNYPDGLTGGPLAASLNAPLLLVDSKQYKDAKDYRATTNAAYCATFGGSALISDAAVYDIMYNYITSKQLKDNAADYKIVDTRKTADYEAGRIYGSVSADVDSAVAGNDNTASEAVENIKAVVEGDDTKYALVCYSGNRYARTAAAILVKQGVDPSNIFILKGGIADWTKSGYTVYDGYFYVTPLEIRDAIGTSEYVVLDARKEADYKASHIPGAYSADVDGTIQTGDVKDEKSVANVKAVVDAKGTDAKYAIACYSGNRYAKNTTAILKELGVPAENIYTIKGGMKQWNADCPNYIVKETISSKNYTFENTITAANLKADVDGSRRFTVVDLRTADLYDAAHIPGAVSAQARYDNDKENEDALAKANLEKVVNKHPGEVLVLVCYSGNNFAEKARKILTEELNVEPQNVVVLEGGQGAWTNAKYPTTAIVIDKAEKSVAFTVTASAGFVNNSTAIEHLITSTGGNHGKALFDTTTTALDFYDALEAVGSTPWAADTTSKLADGKKFTDFDVRNMAGTNADYTRYDVELYDGDTKVGNLEDILKYQKNGVAQKTPHISMMFSGNKKNQTSTGSGCVACLFSCWAGVTSNENVGFNTCKKDQNYFYADTTKLTAGKNYRIVFKVKPVAETKYVSVEDTFNAMNNDDVVILDVRQNKDYVDAHIPGAVSASCAEHVIGKENKDGSASANLDKIVAKYGKDKKYYLVCYSGKRYAAAATELLASVGVTNVYTVTGGMGTWNTKYPNYVVKTYQSTGKFDFMNGISVANLKADVEGSKKFVAIDLRTVAEYDTAHIDGAVNAAQKEVDDATAEANLDRVVKANPNAKFVLICYSGNSFANKARNTMVQKFGIDEKNIIILDGGHNGWVAAGYPTVATQTVD